LLTSFRLIILSLMMTELNCSLAIIGDGSVGIRFSIFFILTFYFNDINR